MTWPTGISTINEMLGNKHLERVNASLERSIELLDAAERHVESAAGLSVSDPDGAYSLLYDAARKALAAVLQAQGLRPTSRGGHYAIQQAAAAQFTQGPPATAFRSFGRLRRTRNQSEYDVSTVTADDIVADTPQVRAIVATARALVESIEVFMG